MTSTSLTFQDTKLTYFTSGTGFPLVFIHGFCEDHSVWSETPAGNDFVNPFMENYRVILPDIPGFGKSLMDNDTMHRVATAGATMDFYADCIKTILDAENISSCAMIGHSMGGYITMNFALRFPGYLKGFGLFHSTTYADDEAKKADREKASVFVRKNGVIPFVNELYDKLFGAAYVADHADHVAALKKYAAEISSTEGVANASIAMRDRKDTTDVLKKSPVPILFIIGKEDKAVSPDKTMQLTHLADSAVIAVLEKAGHMGMVESPDECRKAINEWLSLIA